MGEEREQKRVKLVKFLTACAELWNEEMTETKIALYWAVLKDYPEEDLDRAFVEVLRKSKFFPKPADIVEEIEKLREGDPLLALHRLEETIERYGIYYSVSFIDRKINTAVKALGGWVAVCNYDTRFLARDFQEVYKQAPPSEVYLPGWIEAHGGVRIPFVVVGRRRVKELKVPADKLDKLIAKLANLPYDRILKGGVANGDGYRGLPGAEKGSPNTERDG